MTTVSDLIDRAIADVETTYGASRFVDRHGARLLRSVGRRRVARTAAQSTTSAAAAGALVWGVSALPWGSTPITTAGTTCESPAYLMTVAPAVEPIELIDHLAFQMVTQNEPQVRMEIALLARGDQADFAPSTVIHDAMLNTLNEDIEGPVAVAAVLSVAINVNGDVDSVELLTPDGQSYDSAVVEVAVNEGSLAVVLDGEQFSLAESLSEMISVSFGPITIEDDPEHLSVRDEDGFVVAAWEFSVSTTEPAVTTVCITPTPSPSPTSSDDDATVAPAPVIDLESLALTVHVDGDDEYTATMHMAPASGEYPEDWTQPEVAIFFDDVTRTSIGQVRVEHPDGQVWQGASSSYVHDGATLFVTIVIPGYRHESDTVWGSYAVESQDPLTHSETPAFSVNLTIVPE